MHLCETFLAWYEASRDERSLEDAISVAEFVQSTFWQSDRNVLFEFSDLAEDNHVEIGHLYEWVWILGRLRKLSGQPLMPFAHDLYEAALAWDDKQSYLPLASFPNGTVKIAKQRTWGLTEALKAHIAQADIISDDIIIPRIMSTVDALFQDHLTAPVSGGWVDEISPDGKPLANWMTPATGYHIFLAFAEYLEFTKPLMSKSN